MQATPERLSTTLSWVREVMTTT